MLLRDKSGALAQRDPFFSFFDHIVRSYDALADYTLFMHGHDTHYHRQAPTALVVEQAFRLVDSRAVGYVNLGAAVHSTWAGCASFGAIQRAAPSRHRTAAGPAGKTCAWRGMTMRNSSSPMRATYTTSAPR